MPIHLRVQLIEKNQFELFKQLSFCTLCLGSNICTHIMVATLLLVNRASAKRSLGDFYWTLVHLSTRALQLHY